MIYVLRGGNMAYRVTNHVTEEERAKVREGLLQYNLPRFENTDVQELGIFCEDENGITAGIIGESHGEWLEIEFLWVDEKSRGQAIGSTLLQKAEDEAKRRGCKHVFLNTFSFQAPEFYPKYGYKEVFVLNDYPVTGKKYFFVKAL